MGRAGQGMTVVERAKRLILTPRAEWEVVAAEPTTIGQIYASYALPLALIPAVAGFVGACLVGMGVPGLGNFRVPLGLGLASAVVQLGIGLALVYVLSMIVDGLAPTFGAEKNLTAAFKLVAYAYTPAWLAGIFNILPSISFLTLLGLYSVYLLHVGLPRLMRVPPGRAGPYTAVVVIAGIVLAVVVGGVLGLAFGRPMM
jgi:hypothetical protein